MKKLERYALVSALIEALRAKGSWCGETHVQKGVFLAQSVLGVPFGYQFVLYKHGPYSFELRDEITAMRADEIVELQPQSYPYGPSLNSTQLAKSLQRAASKPIQTCLKELEIVASICGNRGVVDLERLATGCYVSEHYPQGTSVLTRARRLNELKPHVPLDAAIEAVKEADQIRSKRIPAHQ